MPSTHATIRFAWIGLATAAFIVYGSLYPFDFHGGSIVEAVHHLLQSNDMRDQPWSGLIANIAFYMPLGFFCMAGQNRARPALLRLLGSTVIGAMMCLAMETIQFFDAGRISTLTDVYPNTAGTFLGSLIALLSLPWLDYRGGMDSPARRIAVLLLLSFLVYRLFPYAPTIDLHAYWRAVKPMVTHPAVNGFDVFSYTVKWTVVAALLADLAGWVRSRWLILVAMPAVIFCKIIIVHNHLTLSELLALPIAALAWQILSSFHRRRALGVLAMLLALVIAGNRLLPFDWQAAGHAFGWVPFASVMHGSLSGNAQSLAEKTFLYTSLVWLLATAGLRYATAGILAGTVLFATSLIETHLPGRSAEITDALIALIAAVFLHWLSGSTSKRNRAGSKPGSMTATD